MRTGRGFVQVSSSSASDLLSLHDGNAKGGID